MSTIGGLLAPPSVNLAGDHRAGSRGGSSAEPDSLSPFATTRKNEASDEESQHGQGRLVIVGSGIRSLGQMTFEALGHIKAADVVYYAVADPLTEAFIDRHAKSAHDLCMLYDDGKVRVDTYVQMAEVMLQDVRAGRYVVGVFYGHPGVFAMPSHRAIAIARDEGFSAQMLAGVSAEDNLFADLGFDPAHPGCQTLEATDLLQRAHPIATELHLVLFQVGVVGDRDYDFNRFKNRGFDLLINRLIAAYGEGHDVYHYVAAMYAPCRPFIERLKLGDFRNPEVARKVTVVSTFYLPPNGPSSTVAEAISRGLSHRGMGLGDAGPYATHELYGASERAAIDALGKHRIPKRYRGVNLSDALYDAMYALATDPLAQRELEQSPDTFFNSHPQLREIERNALLAPRMRILHDLMRDEVGSDWTRCR